MFFQSVFTSLCVPRTLITGMASGSIVAFNIDFNRWHYEHQNRYWAVVGSSNRDMPSLYSRMQLQLHTWSSWTEPTIRGWREDKDNDQIEKQQSKAKVKRGVGLTWASGLSLWWELHVIMLLLSIVVSGFSLVLQYTVMPEHQLKHIAVQVSQADLLFSSLQ